MIVVKNGSVFMINRGEECDKGGQCNSKKDEKTGLMYCSKCKQIH